MGRPGKRQHRVQPRLARPQVQRERRVVQHLLRHRDLRPVAVRRRHEHPVGGRYDAAPSVGDDEGGLPFAGSGVIRGADKKIVVPLRMHVARHTRRLAHPVKQVNALRPRGIARLELKRGRPRVKGPASVVKRVEQEALLVQYPPHPQNERGLYGAMIKLVVD